MGIGIYFIWTLFHRDPSSIDKCIGDANTSSDPEVNQWVCANGFKVVRVVVVVILCIVWIFQISERLSRSQLQLLIHFFPSWYLHCL